MKKGKIIGLISVIMALLLGTTALVGCAGGTIDGGDYDKSDAHVNEYFYEEDIYHDQAAEFMTPQQPTKDDNVTLRLKVKRGLATEATVKYSFDLDVGDEVKFCWDWTWSPPRR